MAFTLIENREISFKRIKKLEARIQVMLGYLSSKGDYGFN